MPIEKSNEPEAFASFEREGWERSLDGYDEEFGAISRQTVGPMLDAAEVGEGSSVLDLCCGPGMLSAGAIERGARPVGVDYSEAALARARRLVPAADLRAGDAQSLDFPDTSFDAVVCGYGLMHLPDPERALREMVRVVRPGGRVAVSVWDGSLPDAALNLIFKAVQAHGDGSPDLPHGPDFFQFGTVDRMQSALVEIDLADVRATRWKNSVQVTSGAELLGAVERGSVRASAVLDAQSESALANMARFLDEKLTGMPKDDGGYFVQLPSTIGSGAKP
ncbi:class I SAM-dependent methyltransferase [Minwuia thermotolerans]|uniref:Methyltransferase type 11 domain-containing protein n=1 Tax=Minwuia thermotolerans TaxID=2056226 RepID=A0A2M9G623_9PROT|nr:class I SAM-dependent methyltransferase [Minwuia thermotolerans]PJK31116.1 hypothetical protein CVT23_02455 [Minwuia thermotolerans]